MLAWQISFWFSFGLGQNILLGFHNTDSGNPSSSIHMETLPLLATDEMHPIMSSFDGQEIDGSKTPCEVEGH